METDRALAALSSSPKYRGVYPGAVERIYSESLRRHGPKGADKAARAELHRITGAFLSPKELKLGRSLIERAKSGETDVLTQALALHASSRERLPDMVALYDRALPALGNPRLVLDLACGLNPLAAAWMPLAQDARYTACDIYTGLVDFLNAFFAHIDLTGEASLCDLVDGPPAADGRRHG